MEEEQEIDLLDLCKRILRKWKFVIIMMIICALALDGVAFLKSKKTRDNYLASSSTSNTATVKSVDSVANKYKGTLSDSELAETKLGAQAYLEFLEKYDETISYYNDSMLMQLDASKLPTVRLQYTVDANYEVEYPIIEKTDPTASIIGAYSDSVTSMKAEIYEDIANQMKESDEDEAIQSSYIEELITVDNTSDENNNFSVYIYCDTEDHCGVIAEAVKQYIEDETSDIQKVYGDFDITLVQDNFYYYVNNELLTKQQQQVTAISSLRSTANSISSSYTDDQKSCYKELITCLLNNLVVSGTDGEESAVSDNIKSVLVEDGIITAEKETTASAPALEYFNKKYVVVGAFIGAFFACCWIGLIYIISGTLKTNSELESYYKLSMLGNIKTRKPSIFAKKGPQFTEAERIDMICAGVGIAVNKGELKSVYVTGSCNDEVTEKVKALILEGLKSKNVAAKSGNTIVYDPESLEAMAASDGVVLVERVDYSLTKDIRKEIEMCEKYGVGVIGAVGVE